MRKGLIFFCILGFLFLSTSIVFADAGPKPELKITVIHAPHELYYLDLLVRSSYLGPNDHDLAGFNQDMVENLKSLALKGWYPAFVSGTAVPLFGDLLGDSIDGKWIHQFGYRIPDEFRIILVTQSGKVTISEPIQVSSFYFSIKFDAESGVITLPNRVVQYGYQFLTTFIPTLILEGLILWMFGLFTKRNFIVFLIMNLITQIFLSFTLGVALITSGLISALFVLIFVEGFIWIFEIIMCWKFFDKKKKTSRRIVYALVANMASFLLGFFLIFIQFSWLG